LDYVRALSGFETAFERAMGAIPLKRQIKKTHKRVKAIPTVQPAGSRLLF
jgi:hypothetical protein